MRVLRIVYANVYLRGIYSLATRAAHNPQTNPEPYPSEFSKQNLLDVQGVFAGSSSYVSTSHNPKRFPPKLPGSRGHHPIILALIVILSPKSIPGWITPLRRYFLLCSILTPLFIRCISTNTHTNHTIGDLRSSFSSGISTSCLEHHLVFCRIIKGDTQSVNVCFTNYRDNKQLSRYTYLIPTKSPHMPPRLRPHSQPLHATMQDTMLLSSVISTYRLATL